MEQGKVRLATLFVLKISHAVRVQLVVSLGGLPPRPRKRGPAEDDLVNRGTHLAGTDVRLNPPHTGTHPWESHGVNPIRNTSSLVLTRTECAALDE